MKREKGWLTSKTFAALCGTTKETLWHYKNAGLLLPGPLGYFRGLCRAGGTNTPAGAENRRPLLCL